MESGTTTIETNIRNFIKQQMARHNTPGLAIAVTDRDSLLMMETYGYANIDLRQPVDNHSRFLAGSITKLFTAVGILQAAEKGLLDLNEPVKRYLPWFRVKTKAHQITAHHLLSHTASLPLGRDDLPPSRYAAAALAEFEPTFPPGKYYYDSNVDYHILQFLLEDVTGTPYGEVIRQNIFDPLDMCESYAAITHDIRAKIVVGYQRLHNDRPGHWTYPLTPAPWFEWTAADGSVAATAKDLAIFCRMLLNQGRLNNVHILSEASYKLMTARVAQRFKDSYFGLGTYVRLMDGNTIIGHGGNMPGHQSMMLGDTDTGIGAVVLINGPGSPWAIASYVLSQYRARHRGEPVSAVVPVEDEMMVENASDYVGTYTGHNRTVSVISEGKRLILIYDSHHVVLEPREDDDVFYANHKSLRLFLWQFEREDNKVVAANYGPHWYANENYIGSLQFQVPDAWKGYCGHYQIFSPWDDNRFRVIITYLW